MKRNKTKHGGSQLGQENNSGANQAAARGRTLGTPRLLAARTSSAAGKDGSLESDGMESKHSPSAAEFSVFECARCDANQARRT